MDIKKFKTADRESIAMHTRDWMKKGAPDCTLIADVKKFDVHSIFLAATSKYFDKILDNVTIDRKNKPTFFFQSVSADGLELVLSYIYKGEVDVEANKSKDFLAILKFLKIANPVEVLQEKDQVPKVRITRSKTMNLSNSSYSVGQQNVTKVKINSRLAVRSPIEKFRLEPRHYEIYEECMKAAEEDLAEIALALKLDAKY